MNYGDLLGVAYRFYPKNVSPFIDDFNETIETINFKKELESGASVNKPKLERFQQLIRSHCGLESIDQHGGSLGLPSEYVTLLSKEHEILLKTHIWISNIIPMHVIESYTAVLASNHWGYAFEVREGSLHEDLSQMTTSVFGTSPFPSGLLDQQVPFVSTIESKGKFATFRELLFSSYIANY